MLVSVSVLNNRIKPQDIVKKLDLTKASFIHLDVMDGKFVENKTWTMSEIKKFTSYSKLPLDVHLMVENPKKYINEFALMNTRYITFHYEAVKNINELIDLIDSYGLKVGISINPDTDVKVLLPYLNRLDMVLVMGVFPGKSGQTFIDTTPERINELKELIDSTSSKAIISVDGGINDETGKLCADNGCDMLVSASFIHEDIINNVNKLKNI